MNEQKRSLYVLSWQILRVHLDFRTMTSTQNSIKAVLRYIEDHGFKAADYYKAVNLFAATVMGFEGQVRNYTGSCRTNDEVPQVRDLRKRIEEVRTARERLSRSYAAAAKDENTFKVDISTRYAELYIADTADLIKVHKSLRARWVGANKRKTRINRPELAEYLFMLETELISRNATYKPAGVTLADFS